MVRFLTQFILIFLSNAFLIYGIKKLSAQSANANHAKSLVTIYGYKARCQNTSMLTLYEELLPFNHVIITHLPPYFNI